jgi:heparanase 1
MKSAIAPLRIGKSVYGSSWAGISADDAQGFIPTVVAGGGVTGMTVHNYPYGGRDCVVENYLDKSKITTDLAKKLEAVVAVKASTPGAESLLLVLEETAGSSGGGCDNVTDRFVAGFCWMNTLITVGRSGFDRVHRQDIAGWSFAFGESHYQLVGPPGWVVGSQLLTPHPDYWTTLLWRQLVGYSVLSTNVTGGAQSLLDSVDLSMWCAAPNTSPYGAGTIVMAFTVMSVDTDVTLTLPAALQSVAMSQYYLSAPNDDLQSDDILLNGQALQLGAGGALLEYPIKGKAVAAGSPLVLAKLSYGFIAFDSPAAACS